MAVFGFGSIEDAPLDALAEGRNPNNPISKGYLSSPDAWKLSAVLAFIGLIFSGISYPSAVLVHLGFLVVGIFYFHHALRLRQNAFLDALGFSIITVFFPFISAANLPSIQFGDNSLVTGSLAFFLTYATYFTMIDFQDNGMLLSNSKLRLPLGGLVVPILIVITSLFVFTFSGLVPAWVSLLMLVLFLIMVYPQFSKHKSIQSGTNVHLVFANYQRALAIALTTFFLATQIFNILR